MNYTVRSVRDTGTITYHCAGVDKALEKVRDFRDAEYRNIRISAGGRFVSERRLAAMAGGRTVEPSQI